MLCHVMSGHVISCHVKSGPLKSCHGMSSHVTSSLVTSYPVKSGHVRACHAPVTVSSPWAGSCRRSCSSYCSCGPHCPSSTPWRPPPWAGRAAGRADCWPRPSLPPPSLLSGSQAPALPPLPWPAPPPAPASPLAARPSGPPDQASQGLTKMSNKSPRKIVGACSYLPPPSDCLKLWGKFE